MKAPNRLALLCIPGLLAVACFENRPIVVGLDGGVGSPGAAGAATTGAAGAGGDPGGGAGKAGPGGAGGAPAQGGGGGVQGHAGGAPVMGGGGGNPGTVPVRGCDVTPLFGTATTTGKYFCTIQGACHDANQSATQLDMTSANWEQNLLGTFPTAKAGEPFGSLCLASKVPYLIKGSIPAQGLFLDKLRGFPCGAQMPNIGGPITASDMACIQAWADALTAM
jgi:hypothetical protein